MKELLYICTIITFIITLIVLVISIIEVLIDERNLDTYVWSGVFLFKLILTIIWIYLYITLKKYLHKRICSSYHMIVTMYSIGNIITFFILFFHSIFESHSKSYQEISNDILTTYIILTIPTLIIYIYNLIHIIKYDWMNKTKKKKKDSNCKKLYNYGTTHRLKYTLVHF